MTKFLRVGEFAAHSDDRDSVSALAEGGAVFRITPRGRVWCVFGGHGFSDGDIEHLLGLPQLIEFNLLHFTNMPTRFTDRGFRHLMRHQQLQAVMDQNNRCLTDATADCIARKSSLRWVKLPHCPITDRGVESISEAKQLLGLSLNNNAISDECVPALCRLTNLRNLWIKGTEISTDGVARPAEPAE